MMVKAKKGEESVNWYAKVIHVIHFHDCSMQLVIVVYVTSYLYCHMISPCSTCIVGTPGYSWAVNLQMLLCCLLVLFAALPVSIAQSCPVPGCTGCGTTVVDCSLSELTTFPQLPLDVQQSVEIL